MGKRKKTNCTTFVCQFVVVLETEASESSLGPDTLLKTRTIHRFPHAPKRKFQSCNKLSRGSCALGEHEDPFKKHLLRSATQMI